MEAKKLIVDFLRWAKKDSKFLEVPFETLADRYIESKPELLNTTDDELIEKLSDEFEKKIGEYMTKMARITVKKLRRELNASS